MSSPSNEPDRRAAAVRTGDAPDGFSETVDSGPRAAAPSGSREAPAGVERSGPEAAFEETRPVSGTQPSGKSSGFTGRKIGEYELLGEIARGGMGVVYKARQPKLDRIVALKMILAGQLASQDEVERFYREARAAATLEHPGIVPVIEVNSHDDLHYYSMGFVDGCSLQDRIAAGPLAPREAARLLRQIAEAIHYAHQQGVVHRDLKPRNILLTRDDQPKVTDFGLAKRVDGAGELTASGAVLGTPGYMPPEQAAGRLDDVGPRSDLYSLGAVLYCLLTGRPPFEGSNLVETLRKVQEEPPVPPRRLVPSTPVDLETICLKCLDKSPAARYASAAELRDELGRFLAGDPILARRTGAARRLWLWVRRRPAVAALIASIAALVVVGLFSGQAVKRAYHVRRTTEASNAVDRALETIEPDAESLKAFDTQLERLEALDPAAAAERRTRLARRLAALLLDALRQPKLDNADLDRLESRIALLRGRAPELAAELTDELASRRREWRPLAELAPPFERIDEFFASTDVARRDEPPGPASLEVRNPGRVLTRLGVSGAVEFAVQFATGWNQADRLGVLLSADAEQGYEFVLEGVGGSSARQDESNQADAGASEPSGRSSPAVRRSLASSVDQTGRLAMAIYRHRLPVIRRTILAADAPADRPLVLRATRQGGRLAFQVNQSPVVAYDDPFPLRTGDRGRFGLIWPAPARLERADVRRQSAPLAASPLEQGDEAYDAGNLESALEFFRRQAAESSDADYADEARFKQAVCLEELGRTDESDALFGELSQRPGKRWPLLAGARLWLSQLRQKKRDESNLVFESLSARFSFGEVAAFLPESTRREILDGLQVQSSSMSAFRMDPARIADYQRWASVDRFLSVDGRGQDWVQIELGRTLQFHGDTVGALRAMEPTARDSTSDWILRQYSRILRQTGRADEAERYAQEFFRRVQASDREPGLLAYVERSQIAAARGDWSRCELWLDRALARQRSDVVTVDPTLPEVALMKGFLLDRRGEPGGATAVWRAAYERLRAPLAAGRLQETPLVLTAVLGSLVGQITESEAQVLRTTLLSAGGGSWFSRQADGVINPQTLHAALQHAWTTPLGRRHAWMLAFDETNRRERWKIPASRTAVAYMNQAAVRGEWTAEQEQAAYDVLSRLFEEFMTSGQLSVAQVAQLALTWKGTTNFLGWGGVSPTLDPPLRAGLAYCFAHRALAQNNPAQAKEYFETAKRDAPPDSSLQRLAVRDAELLAAGQASIRLESDSPQPVRVELVRGGEVLAQAEVSGEAELRVPAGPVDVRLPGEPAELRLSRRTLDATVAGSRLVRIEWRWAATDEQRGRAGLAPAPASRVAPQGWQLIRRHPIDEPVTIGWTPDGGRCVAASRSGAVRVYDARSGTLVRYLPRTFEGLTHVALSPTEPLLLAGASDGSVGVWNLADGTLRFVRNDHATPLTSVAWSPDGRRFASVSGQHEVVVGKADGSEVRRIACPCAWSAQVALSDDARVVCVLDHGPSPAVVWRLEGVDGPWQRITDESPAFLGQIACDPRGRWIAAFRQGVGIRIWSAAESRWTKTLDVSGAWVEALVPAADGGRLRAVLQQSGVLEFDPTGPESASRSLFPSPHAARNALAPDGERSFFRTLDGRFGVLSVKTGEPTYWNERLYPSTAANRSSGPSSRLAIAGLDGVVRLIAADDAAPIALPFDSPQSWLQLVWSPDGRRLAGTSIEGWLVVWNSTGEIQRRRHLGVPWGPLMLTWEDAGHLLVPKAGDGLSRYKVDDDQLEEQAWPDLPRLFHAAASGDGATALVTSTAVEVRRRGGPVLQTYPRLPWTGLEAPVWSHDGRRLCLPYTGVVCQIVSPTQGGEAPTELRIPGATAAAWSPDDSQIAVGSANGQIGVWDAQGRRVRTLYANAAVRRLAFSAPDRIEALTDEANWVRWDLTTGRPSAVQTSVAGRWVRLSGGGRPVDLPDEAAAQLTYVLGADEAARLLTAAEFHAATAETFRGDGADAPTPAGPVVPTPVAAGSSDAAVARPLDGDLRQTGALADPAFDEVSGLAAASDRPDAYWLHNDSESPARLHLIGADGKPLARFELDGLQPLDWEDLARFRQGDRNFLLLADVGDNGRQRKTVELHLVEEPATKELPAQPPPLKIVRTISVRYEDGPHDCEAAAVDVAGNRILLVTKELDETCSLFELPLDAPTGETVTAKRVAAVRSPLVTGMDISPDGARLVLLSGLTAAEYTRAKERTWAETLAGEPERWKLPALRQAEAIAYTADGSGWVVTSEGVGAPIWQVTPRRRATGEPPSKP